MIMPAFESFWVMHRTWYLTLYNGFSKLLIVCAKSIALHCLSLWSASINEVPVAFRRLTKCEYYLTAAHNILYISTNTLQRKNIIALRNDLYP